MDWTETVLSSTATLMTNGSWFSWAIGTGNTVILKLTLRHKTDSTDRAVASACRFRSFRRFYVSFFRNVRVMLIVLDH